MHAKANLGESDFRVCPGRLTAPLAHAIARCACSMSDYGDDDIDWGDPTLLAQLDSLETDAATKSSSTANAPNSTLYALQRQPAAPRASQIPPGNVAGASGAAAAANAAPGSTAARRNGGGGHSTLLRTGAATGAAFPTPSQYGNAKPSGILRPPKPPVRAPKPPAPNGVNGTRPLQGAPAAAATAAQDRKPHLARANSAQGGQEADEEDLPAITVDENASATGTGSMYRAEPQRGVTIARPAAAAQRAGSEPSEKDSGARAQSRPTGPVAAPQSGAGRPSAAVPPQAPGPAAIRLQPVHVTSHEQVPRPATAAIQAPQPPPQPAPRGPAVAAGFAAPATAGPNGNAHSTTAPSHAQNAVAGGSGLSAQDREELAALRREKAKVRRPSLVLKPLAVLTFLMDRPSDARSARGGDSQNGRDAAEPVPARRGEHAHPDPTHKGTLSRACRLEFPIPGP